MTLTVEDLDEVQESRDRLTARLNAVVNRLAGRDDLLLTCVWNPVPVPGQPNAPAWFTPATATVTINAKMALGDTDPEEVNPLTPDGRRKHPVVIGLLEHEASHLHSTHWPTDFGVGLPETVVQAAVLLEEPRIEFRQIQRRRVSRPYLRAQSKYIDFRAFEDGTTVEMDRWRAANAAIMTLARADAGVLEPEDVEPVEPILRDRLGAEDLDALREVWQHVLTLEDGDVDGLLEAGQRWADIVGPPPSEGLPAMGCSAGEVPEESEWDEGDADGEGGSGALAEAMMKVSESANEGGTDEIEGEYAARPDPGPVLAKKAQEKEDRAKQEKAKKQASKTFGGQEASGMSRLGAQRQPTPEERALAREIATILRHAKFRERTQTVRHTDLPPGRFDGRQAMLGSAQRSLGIPVTAAPYRSKVRKHVPEPPITLGIMSDKSGSMTWAERITSVITWAFSQAMNQVQGRCASVAFGHNVIPITFPGKPASLLTEIPATDGTEVFRAGFEALDGTLNLTTGQGVRLLVVISDGQYTGVEWKAAEETVERLRRNGAHVLWFSAKNAHTRVPKGALRVDVETSTRYGTVDNGLPEGLSAIPAAITMALAAAAAS